MSSLHQEPHQDPRNDVIRRLEDALVEANGMLRTFHHVVARKGGQTNWDGLANNLAPLLEKQRLHINGFNGYTRDLPQASDGSDSPHSAATNQKP